MASKEFQQNIRQAAEIAALIPLLPVGAGIVAFRRYPKLTSITAGLMGLALVVSSQPTETQSKNVVPVPVSTPINNPENRESAPIKAGLFKDTKASEVAKANNIDTGDFFLFKKETLDKLDAFLGPDLYPIYPPAVIEQQDLIYRLADEFNVPPNVAAIIMSIESAGTKNTPSYVGAQGLFQVMPHHFEEEFGKEYVAQNPHIMTDPYINGKLGMRFFVNYCLTTSRDQLVGPNYGTNHVSVFARALTAYNAGPGTVPYKFDDLPEETKFYGDHFIRFALTAQIAKGLRDSGYTDQQIVQALTLNSNLELDARMKAIQDLHDEAIKTRRGYSYLEYEGWLKELSFSTPGVNQTTGQSSELGQKIKGIYDNYKNNPTYNRPLSPGLRFWVNMGGIGLLDLENVNTNPDNYSNMQTKKRNRISSLDNTGRGRNRLKEIYTQPDIVNQIINRF